MRLRWVVWLFLFFACSQKNEGSCVIIWEREKAVAISTVEEPKTVVLDGSSETIIGDISEANGRFTFTPAVPFQRGNTYTINSKFSFKIPPYPNQTTPAVLNVYPTCDTLPANLLKAYIQYSEPMSEGKSYSYFTLHDKTENRQVENGFLDLKPELWNEKGTILTLWLNPGRIKQGLIPNKELGPVLKENHQYQLIISHGMQSRLGIPSAESFTKEFTTTKHDVIKPDIEEWSITTRKDSVIINTKESLDWSLLNNTISVWKNNKQISVKSISEVCEKHLTLISNEALSKGNYELRIEARLEDLAGNNLNRLFETDITKPPTSPSREVYSIPFTVN